LLLFGVIPINLNKALVKIKHYMQKLLKYDKTEIRKENKTVYGKVRKKSNAQISKENEKN